MVASSMGMRTVKVLGASALLVTAALFHDHLLAQATVTINRIPVPVTDTGIALAPAVPAPIRTPSAPGAWGGMRTGAEATLSDRVVDYRIDATLDPVKHTVDGKQTLTWRNRSDAEVRSVYLHLYMNAFESAGSTYFTEQRNGTSGFREDIATNKGEWGHIDLRRVTQAGKPVPWAYVQPDNGPATDHTVVRFDLPAPVAAGASTVLDIDFLTQLPRIVARTGYFGTYHLVGQWFPKIGVLELPGERGATAPRWNIHEQHQMSEYYADFGSFDVKLRVPKGFVVGATGQLQGTPVEAKGMVTHHYKQGDVHDFAWTADSASAPPLQDTWRAPGSAPVKLTVIYPPEMAASAAPAMQAAKDSLAYFASTLGPYPYPTFTVVIPPHNASESAGMEYPTFVTAAGLSKVRPGTIEEYDIRMVTIHEFGHGYFQGIVASNEVEEPMLDEGLTEYWSNRMLRERKERVHPTTAWLKAIGVDPSFEAFDGVRTGTPREEPADPLASPAYDRLQGIGPVYARTATMMRDLEAQLGQDVMARAMKEYYRRWKFRHPSIADLRETLSEVSGQRALVEQVFEQQVYATSKVDDRIDKFSSEEQLPQRGTRLVGGKRIEEDQVAIDRRVDALRDAWDKAHPKAKPGAGPFPYLTSVTVRRRGAAVPQSVLVTFDDGSSETATWNGGERWKTFTWTRPARAVSAQLDPQRKHLLDTSKLDDTRTLAANSSASRRWGGDFSAFANIVLAMIASL